MSQGVYVLGGKCPGGKCPGGICPWGKCPGGTCPGGLCPRTKIYIPEKILISLFCIKICQFLLINLSNKLGSLKTAYIMSRT